MLEKTGDTIALGICKICLILCDVVFSAGAEKRKEFFF